MFGLATLVLVCHALSVTLPAVAPRSLSVKNVNPIGTDCPLEAQHDGLYPHRYDCTKYLQCVTGYKIERKCPLSLHFNPTLHVCDWPWRAGCEIVSLNLHNGNEKNIFNLAISQECPIEWEPGQDVLLPHEYDCGKFYKCTHGKKVVQDCPKGLHFSVKTKRCEWPRDAGCEI